MNTKLDHNAPPVNQLDVNKKLIKWYDQNAREFPWRVPPILSREGTKPNPYHVWLSEIMLQQTGVKVVEPYFLKFVNKWPNISDLHQASEKDILNLWSGLGYYRRARNLKACAEIVCTQYQGNFPKDEKLLLKLPGIGKYTAAAILTIAFGIPSIVVDGNIERIVARLFALQGTLEKLKPQIHKRMMIISCNDRPGDFAQAMMDLGSTICKPINPECLNCPICFSCSAYKNGTTQIIPERAKRKTKVLRKGFIYLAITKSNKIAMVVRPSSGLLGGTTCPPSSEWNIGEYPENNPPIAGTWVELDKTVKHSFTHFNLELRVMVATISYVPKGFFLKPFNLSTTNSSPSVMRKALNLLLKNQNF